MKNAEEIKEMSRGIVVKTRRVYMKTGIYPAVWRKKEQVK